MSNLSRIYCNIFKDTKLKITLKYTKLKNLFKSKLMPSHRIKQQSISNIQESTVKN